MAGGRKIFEGTPAEARALLPPRVRLRTTHSVAPLQQLPGVTAVRQLPDGAWELELLTGTDPQGILQACFEQRLVLSAFSAEAPALHDVFVHLVGDEAREVKLR
jgi:ABC-2 type transport system ATP-binding protein